MIRYNFLALTCFSFQNYTKICIFSSFVVPVGLKGSKVLWNYCSYIFVFLTSYGRFWELKMVWNMCWMTINLMQKESIEIVEDKGLFCNTMKSTTKLPYFRSALHFIFFRRFWSDLWKIGGHGRVIDHVKPWFNILGPRIED